VWTDLLFSVPSAVFTRLLPDTPVTLLHATNSGISKEELTKSLSQRHCIKRLGHVKDVSNAIVFLASDEASFITGTALPVDGGYLAS